MLQKMFERLQRTPNSLWNNFIIVENRLRSKLSFVHKLQRIYEKFGLVYPSKIRRFTSSNNKRKNMKKFVEAKKTNGKKFEE